MYFDPFLVDSQKKISVISLNKIILRAFEHPFSTENRSQKPFFESLKNDFFSDTGMNLIFWQFDQEWAKVHLVKIRKDLITNCMCFNINWTVARFSDAVWKWRECRNWEQAFSLLCLLSLPFYLNRKQLFLILFSFRFYLKTQT